MTLNNNFMSFLSMMLFLSSYFFLLKTSLKNFIDSFIVTLSIIFTIIFSIITGCYLVANWFTGIGFDDSFFYHLRFGVEGAGISEYKSLILIFFVVQCIFLSVIIFYIRYLMKAKLALTSVKNIFFGFLMMMIAFFCNPASLNLFTYVYSSQGADDFPAYFVTPDVTIEAKSKKNLIYFYLEGLENNYMDEKLFPGLLPELQKIKKESFGYTNVGQTIGGSWTMAGMVSSQCGLPLLSVFTNNNFHMQSFLPNAVCLGDILKAKGYNLEFMGGADMEFAGKGLFYQNHGFDRIAGKQELLNEGLDEKYTNSWGLFDDTLYSLLLQRATELNKTEKNWGLFSINIGTHQPDGHMSQSCEKIKYGDGSHKLLNAIHCTDYLIGALYTKLKREGILKNTLVVFASDHLAPASVNLTDRLEGAQRHNLLMFTGSGISAGENDRIGTTLDVAPTVLDYLGYGSQPLGLGRNLNGEQATLREQFTYDEHLNKKLLSWRTVIDMTFWGYPELAGKISIDDLTQNIKIGDKKLKYPSLIRYTPQGLIQEVSYGSQSMSGDNRFLPAYYIVNMIGNSELFLWVDTCRELSTLQPELYRNTNQYCFYNGSLASEKFISGVITDSTVSFNVLNSIPTDMSITRASNLRQKLRDKNLVEWDKYVLDLPVQSIFPLVGIQSAGVNALVNYSIVAGAEMENTGLFLVRLNYASDVKFGVKYNSEVIVKLDICDKSKGLIDIAALIKSKPADPSMTPLLYAIVGNVEEDCRGRGSNLPTNSHITGLDKAEKGSPFIALFNEQQEVLYQKVGSPDKTIGLGIMLNK
ncbi:sulfatase-like hydrolase/transferase [Klebsiella spallanzanii]|uniref:sulfatase-like hydrolase/transferase n=1 Tax=Klebsiella spallanzanii TaxID=2587528 RepID=UPI00115ADBF1|nr:sulfatase-like hydrolase/transferase [Klebsiella spallanzanii]VUS27343.1 Phosphoglycerol transferase I [Klebsiella spallanzanii]